MVSNTPADTNTTFLKIGVLMSRVFAYARVSTVEQLTENQREQIAAAGYRIEPRRFIEEKVSSSVPTTQRPGFAKLLDRMENGDTLSTPEASTTLRNCSSTSRKPTALRKRLASRCDS